MAQQTISQNAAASLTASGTTTARGTITWTVPSFPEGVTNWDSVIISGMWSWNGKGSINGVNINGTNTTTGIAFNINLPLNVTSPLSITCTGNKNATGSNFIWSNLIITYTYTTQSGSKIMLKVNGIWKEMLKVYKKSNGQWIEQTDLNSVFDMNTKYINANSNSEDTQEYITNPTMEMGDISRTGVLSDSDIYCRTADYVYVKGKTSITLDNGKTSITRVLCYDENKVMIENWNIDEVGSYSYAHVGNGVQLKLPQNCCYIKARFESTTIGTLTINYS